MKQIKPTDSELEILNILWEKGPSSVRDVHEILERSKEAGYTTTLKLMQIMHEKGLLKRDTSSKTHVYEAAVAKDHTQGQLLQRMIDNVFDGSAMSLVMQALGNHKADADELATIRAYLEKLEKGNR